MSVLSIRYSCLLAPAACLCLSAASVTAQESSPHAGIERYLDAETALVGWVDLRQIDAESVTTFALSIDDRAQPPDLKEGELVRQALVKLGVTRVYVAPSLPRIMNGPEAFIVSAPDGQADSVALILKAVVDGDDAAVTVDNGIVLAGQKDAVQRLQQVNGKVSDELSAALRRVDSSNGIVLGVSPSLSVTLTSALLSQTGEHPDTFTRLVTQLPHLKSISLATELPPTSGSLRITSDSSESAQEMASVINEWLAKQIGENAAALALTSTGTDVVCNTESHEESLAALEALKRLLKPARNAVGGRQIINNLKHIALAMHNFHDVHLHFPAQALARDNGDRLLSWRVLILPWLDEAKLFSRFRLDEPWDSEHNIKLLDEMPDVFRAGGADLKPGHTQYVGPITKNSLFGTPGSGVPIRDITDGTSNTLMVMVTTEQNAVPWTKPEDVKVADDASVADVAGTGNLLRVCLCDGSAHRIPDRVSVATFQALLSINGGEIIDWNDINR